MAASQCFTSCTAGTPEFNNVYRMHTSMVLYASVRENVQTFPGCEINLVCQVFDIFLNKITLSLTKPFPNISNVQSFIASLKQECFLITGLNCEIWNFDMSFFSFVPFSLV